ncbi:Helix-turn-helix type 11 domain-containing protein [Paenibacillus terrae HPL-003]|uniref:Helix-turn-helix type 11 domain-containing protein n=1 Tax=Paenibacillus terrae (strain HPL-003) TaxID=985665 RepID=G7W029_PAETH|nr:YafY family protein [Paenibacillus terrae]AET58585.1 Helix-turn-helix type 11 domain-containing protein [Paenibacillus terrae HPL-003]
MSKADHMLSIIWMLKQRRRTAGELAEALEISVRSVYRYIDALCVSGVPVISDAGPGGGYSLPENFAEAPLFFDAEEQKALVQAAAFARGTGYPYVKALDRALDKLKRYSNDRQIERMQHHERGIETLHAPNAAMAEHLQELESATASGDTLHMEYRKANEETILSRSIDPYGLVLWKGQWYTIAYCHQRQEIRSFRADRIAGLRRSGARFVRPADFSARDFLLQSLLPAQDTAEDLVSVVIESSEGILNDLCSHWLFGHTLEQREKGWARFLLDESSLFTYVPYFLLPYGKTLHIREPAALKDRLVAVAFEMARHYEN